MATAALAAGSGLAAIPASASEVVGAAAPSPTLTMYAGNGTDAKPTPGPATKSSVGEVYFGMATDAAGNLYLADDDNDYVYKVTPSGTLSIFAGDGSSGTVTTGPATHEPIGGVDGVTFGPSGNLFLVSYRNAQVYKVTPGGTLSVLAGIGGPNAKPIPGPATKSSIGFPEGIATDHAGDVYITDEEQYYVYKVTPTGTLSIFAGDGKRAQPTVGPAAKSSVGQPEYVAVDTFGNVYITDYVNYLLYKVTPGGTLSVYAGKAGSHVKATPGPASASAVGEPEAIDIDPATNNLFVSDVDNYYVNEITPPPSGRPLRSDGGYLLAGSDGGVFTFGDADFYGSLGAVHLAAPIVAIASTPTGKGYWLLGADGGVFNFGDAGFHGSAVGLVAGQAAAMAATTGGGGYWVAGAEGAIVARGDAVSHGSPAGAPLAKPVAAVAGTPDASGYWLAARDGGIFTYGDAGFYGSLGAIHLAKPIDGFDPTPDGHGYLMVGSDGGVFTEGDAVFHGSLGDITLNAPIIGMAVRG